MMLSMKAVINTIMGAMDGLIWTLGLLVRLLVPGPGLQPVHGPTAQPLEVLGLGPQPVRHHLFQRGD